MPTRLIPDIHAQDHVEGPNSARVTLVEYGDFECPYSAEAVTTVQALQARLREDLRFVYRHFPLAHKHPHAFRAAEASEAAGQQHQFWQMYHMLFAYQDALRDSDLFRYAEDLDLEMAQFKREMAEHTHASRVQGERDHAEQSGVTGTPTFFINGVLYEGKDTLEGLLEAIHRV
ncbi:MAG: DsbA family protein [Nitrospirota bacterium]|nr:DsbA family protein [Nitrospirota bacterium]